MPPAFEDHKCHDSAKEEGKTEWTVVTSTLCVKKKRPSPLYFE